VGGIISDAAETVLAGAGILRSAVGVVRQLAIIAILRDSVYLSRHPLSGL
jgi:hypothetical protein